MKKTAVAFSGLLIAAFAAPLAMAQAASHRDVPARASSLTATEPESAIDADLADRVRRSVVWDRNLSSYAAKINIVAINGIVHLSGLVQNEGEKAQIASKAATIAGQRHVVNDLRLLTNVADGKGLRELLERAGEPRAAVVAAN